MNSSELKALLLELARTNSAAAKVTRLRQAVGLCVESQHIIKLALEPTVTFGLTWDENAAMDIADPVGTNFTDATFDMLEQLASRRLTGGRATNQVEREMACLNSASAALLANILNKDLRCGLGPKTVNKAFPGLLTVFSPMLASSFSAKNLADAVATQPKIDGLRSLAMMTAGGALFLTREGNPIPAVEHLCAPVSKAYEAWLTSDRLKHGDWFLDGELSAGNFYRSSSALRKGYQAAHGAVFHVFDIIPVSAVTAGVPYSAPFEHRQADLAQFLDLLDDDTPIIQLPYTVLRRGDHADFEDTVMMHYAEHRGAGYEGSIVKDLGSRYLPTRDSSWMKLKAEESEDLPVIDAFEGTGKYAGALGGLVFDRAGVAVRVGSGFSDAARRHIWGQWVTDPNLVLGRIWEVEYHEVTPDGSLRHPRIGKLRDLFEKGVKV